MSGLSVKTVVSVGASVLAGAFGVWKLQQAQKAKQGSSCCGSKCAAKAPVDEKEVKIEVQDLLGYFDEIVKGFLEHSKEAFKLPDAAVTRLDQMIRYNVIGGKYWRGVLVLESTQALALGKRQSFTELKKKAAVLGWCIEVLQAYFLVSDDIMDGSKTRRGQPCWYLQPTVQMDAINDAFILNSMIWWMIRTYFADDTKLQLSIFTLFQTVSHATEMGQMMDLISQPQGRKEPEILNNFTEETYVNIVTHKTALYTMYLSAACGMLLTGYTNDADFAKARAIAIELGIKFQIEDDYLDCFQPPEILGKIGTDIQDHKCSWLVVQALRLMSQEQRAALEAHYGKDDEADVALIKQLYRDLKLTEVYEAQEKASYDKIVKMIEDNASVIPPSVFRPILEKIHFRQK